MRRVLRIYVTGEAEAVIQARGGRLYLWQEDFGNAWLRDHLSFEPPEGVVFTELQAEPVSILIADDIDPPRRLLIEKRPLLEAVTVEWDGFAWGQRGESPG